MKYASNSYKLQMNLLPKLLKVEFDGDLMDFR